MSRVIKEGEVFILYYVPHRDRHTVGVFLAIKDIDMGLVKSAVNSRFVYNAPFDLVGTVLDELVNRGYATELVAKEMDCYVLHAKDVGTTVVEESEKSSATIGFGVLCDTSGG